MDVYTPNNDNIFRDEKMSIKTTIRNSLARLIWFLGLSKPERCCHGRLSIVTFHRVLPEHERIQYPFPGLVVTPEELDEILTYLTAHFECGELSTQHERYLSKEISARPLLAITFDDAQHDNFEYARPILNRHQLKASFFVPVVAVDRQELLWHDRLGYAVLALLKDAPDGLVRLKKILASAGLSANGPNTPVSNIAGALKGVALDVRLRLVDALVEASANSQIPEYARVMNYNELVLLARDGHEIGSHSMTHCMMTECNDSDLSYEVEQSRKQLQARLGLSISSFCYPNGNADKRTALAVANAGYLRAVTTDWGSNGSGVDMYRLKRYDMVSKRMQNAQGKFMPDLLAFRMSGFYPGL